MEAHGASFATALAEAQKLACRGRSIERHRWYRCAGETGDPYPGRAAHPRPRRANSLPAYFRHRSSGLRLRARLEVHHSANLVREESFCRLRRTGKLFAAVQPALVPLTSLIAHVEGGRNLVVFTGEFSGQMVFSGLAPEEIRRACGGLRSYRHRQQRGGTGARRCPIEIPRSRQRRFHRPPLPAPGHQRPSRNYCRARHGAFAPWHQHRRRPAEAGIPIRPFLRHHLEPCSTSLGGCVGWKNSRVWIFMSGRHFTCRSSRE